MAVCRPTGGEAQTAAGVRGSRFLPKTARRAPQALEAGAFWAHQPIAIIRIGGIQLGEELFQLPKPQKRRKP